MTTIVTPPAEILLRPTEDVADPTSREALEVAGELLQVLADMPGAAAVAAPQIGSSLRGMAYRDREDGPTVLWNMQIVARKGRQLGWERCLSLPDAYFVERPRSIVVTGVDVLGVDVRFPAHDFQARMLCHEYDHLEGRLVDAIAKQVRRHK